MMVVAIDFVCGRELGLGRARDRQSLVNSDVMTLEEVYFCGETYHSNCCGVWSWILLILIYLGPECVET